MIVWFNKFYVLNKNASLALIDFSFDNSRNIGLEILNNNEVIFWTKNANGSVIELNLNYLINNKEWYHLAITYSSNSKLIYVYINGALRIIKNNELILGETNLNYIGKSDTLNINGSEILIDEIRIYNRVLNSNEIKIDSDDRPITSTTRATTTIDRCKNYYCYNGGTCSADFYSGNAKCDCKTNYNGENCQFSNFFQILFKI